MQVENMSDQALQVNGEWGSPEWSSSYFMTYGVPPIAGGDAAGGGEPAAAGGDESGENDGGSGLYDLSTVPEAYRSDVERIAKEIDGNVTRRFQEAADYRSQWEPYEELGLNEYDPEAIQSLLAFAEIADDQDAFQEWWESVGDEMGFFDSEGEDNGELTDDGGFPDDEQERAAMVAQMLEGMLDERLGPVEQTLSEAQEEALIDEASDLIDERLGELHEEHGDFDDEAVMRLAMAHAPDVDALEKGFADYQEIVNNAATSAINGKANAPSPGGGEGTANTNRKVPVSFDEATEMAKQRLAASG